ncbi:hypothetical protein ACFVVA_38260 [Kitasatospora sp. NPDC058048]|uniref:hypothetical protein n=1 Tax=Kitasatospora sp. NPDC058048 TaxID=3346313 RepID=UPI0036D8AB1D
MEELRHTLDAYVLLGNIRTAHRLRLTADERVALLAVGFAALSAPRVVLNDLTDLVPLCEAIGEALTIGTAEPAVPAAPSGRP